jgi:hydrogenase nickel incorporation protein HypA/HybF
VEGALLNIIRISGKGKCLECDVTFPLTELYGSCLKCGSNRVTILNGEELRVREIEVDD